MAEIGLIQKAALLGDPRDAVPCARKHEIRDLQAVFQKIAHGALPCHPAEHAAEMAFADAAKLGEAVGKRLLDKGIKAVVFDRNGYIYHGIVKSIADGARKAGVQF